jgi:hypothetical protein
MEHARQAQSHRQLPDTVQGGDHPNDNERLLGAATIAAISPAESTVAPAAFCA